LANTFTPQQLAREILDIFVNHFKEKPGNLLRSNNFIVLWPDRGFDSAQFTEGLTFAVENGWLELNSADSYRLTQAGFDAA
jgi:hypothetical protein